jgi:hypothetical protein
MKEVLTMVPINDGKKKTWKYMGLIEDVPNNIFFYVKSIFNGMSPDEVYNSLLRRKR